MSRRYKNIFFDLDDTLWAFSENAYDTFQEMYHKYAYDRFSLPSTTSISFIRSGT